MHENAQRNASEEKPKRKYKDTAEWTWRVACLALLIADLWLKSNFVTLTDYKADKKEMDGALIHLTTLIGTMEERNKVNDRQDDTLKDHEQRLRWLELKTK